MYYLLGLAESWAPQILGQVLLADDISLQSIEHRGITILYYETQERRLMPEISKLRVHNDLLLKVMEMSTTLPFSYGCLVEHLDDSCHFIDKKLKMLQAMFQKCRGMVELGLKILSLAAKSDEFADNCKNGTAYMRKMANAYRYRQEQLKEAQQRTDKVLSTLKQLSTEHVWKWKETGNVLCDSAYLIKREDWPGANSLVACHYPGPDIKYHLSGPWPPYSFVTNLSEGILADG